MSVETTTQARLSRRSLLTGSIGTGLAAIAAVALGNRPADGANGDPVLLGRDNTAGAPTYMNRNDHATQVVLAASYAGVAAFANDGLTAVSGSALGNSALGVQGSTLGHHTQVAVDADTTAGFGEGISVRARTKNGIALYGEATGGAAIYAVGPAVFSYSGKIVFPKGTQNRTITGHRITGDSLVLATIQGAVAGMSVLGVGMDAQHQRFTVRLNRPASQQLVVGWFLIN